MKAPLRSLLVLVACATPLFAQSPAKLKRELRSMENAAKKDPDALFAAGQWAADKDLAADAKRIFQAVLKIAPEHEGANQALGNELVDGKWVSAKDAEELRRKAMVAEYEGKGWTQVSGIWVAPEHAEDAKKGIFHHDGEVLTKNEMEAIQQKGMVRHPVTGQLIERRYLDKAEKRYFQTGVARWVDEKEANQFHSDLEHPWIVRSKHCLLLSTLPIDKIEPLREQADAGVERVRSLFGDTALPPARRPVIWIAATESEYRDLGNALGDGTDACGAALIREEAKFELAHGEVRGAICNNHKDWGERYLRHAAAISYVHALADAQGITLPLWFLHGVGAYTSRFHVERDAAWFGKLHQQKGGVRGLRSFFSAYTISGDMESTQIDYNIYGAGLLFSFANTGLDEGVNQALKEVVDLLTGATTGKADKAFAKLEAAFTAAEPKIAEHLQEWVAKSP